MKKFLLLACLSSAASAADWESKTFLVDMDYQCSEGNVTCDQIVFRVENKDTGEVLNLNGSTWHTLCADRSTPCRFQGYKFYDGTTTYWLQQDGLLAIVRNRTEVLLSERGTWRE